MILMCYVCLSPRPTEHMYELSTSTVSGWVIQMKMPLRIVHTLFSLHLLIHSHSQSEFFNMYGAYMNEFKVAMQTLAKYEHSSQAFRQEVRSCQQLSECDGLPLSAFLLTPVQRLPRYELLLKVCVYFISSVCTLQTSHNTQKQV